MEWLYEFEYEKLGIPKPDIVIYLKVDVEISQELMNKRYHGDKSKKDIHENNLEYLKKSREAAEYCGQKLGWKIIECCEDGEMKSIDSVHKEILKVITENK